MRLASCGSTHRRRSRETRQHSHSRVRMDRGTSVDGALSQLQHAWATFVNSSFVEETLKVAADASAAAAEKLAP